MTPPVPPTRLQELVNRLARGDRSAALALHALISAADSQVKIFVIPTNEELVVAREAKRFLEAKKN